MLVSSLLYIPLSVLAMLEPVNTLLYQLAEWTYTTSAAFFLTRLSLDPFRASEGAIAAKNLA